MDANETKVNNLKKITLSLKAGTTPQTMDLMPQSSELEFIFGIGTSGLTPFEYKIVNKTSGDEITLYLKRKEIYSTFEHMTRPVLNLLNVLKDQDSFYLKAHINNVVPANNKEIVKAMAAINSCEGDCGCGCDAGSL